MIMFLKVFVLIFSVIADGLPAVQNILAQLEIGAVKSDCEIVVSVCQAVSKRAAHLCAAGKWIF